VHILLEESFSETNSNYTEQQMASKVEVNRQSILNDGEKENLSINVLVAVLVGILTAVILLYLWKKSRVNRRGICLVGLCESGKTLIYNHLIYDKAVETYTSMKENIGSLEIKNKRPLKLIDIPGHERVRQQFFDTHKSSARGIIFVIDSNSFMKDIRDVAQYLYNILTDSLVSSNRPAVLVLCNKQDHTLAKGQKVIQLQLEKEMNVLRTTQVNQLETVENEGKSSNVFLGREGKDFEFEDLKNMNIEFCDSSAHDGNIEDLQKWLQSVA